ncbi:hypothetical protein RVBP17_1680 [Pseudomonas phage sp. 30-3]|uniref:Heat shock protein n=1 Tax=Pseudomonas phage vB_PaeM_PA5oct TaxID=2163605 RepID=A0A4Y1LUT0_9CAUD|nr:Hsp20 heat shock protein [Pseudomonas phage vB_PaeM_PA5oct]WMI31803.1 small heat shock protein [Pseudomonas phage Callisto]WPK38733.1 Hsp20 heat shock protein [Pseudomonas phage Cassandra]WPK39254.1 Hsp20 heat shock protein [Pseudomonas phage Deifobo]WPK39766.1 Hsp20 heat shock protein [Pseudomonas phage Ettore]WPK40287.1 Hsp20 heat shock protein [Pseudomonas phage Paride]VOH54096.1 Small heat shock protein IbpB [Pseudomonas phage vB_PaeM_MIJ3]BDR25789.1 hypothetical protein RVBP16_2290 [
MQKHVIMSSNLANYRYALGATDLLNTITNELSSQKFPPHNLIKNADGSYCLELALAGYDKSELDVYVDSRERLLVIETKPERIFKTEVEYEHKGISSKDFSVKFRLVDDLINISSCGMKNGILTIKIQPPSPAESQRKVIDIE